MGSHSVTIHLAEVICLPQLKLGLDLATPVGCKAELTLTGCAWSQKLLKINAVRAARGVDKNTTKDMSVFAFTALKLLAGHQEEHLAGKKLSDEVLVICMAQGADCFIWSS